MKRSNRTQRTYDHRLRQLVYTTDNIKVALDLYPSGKGQVGSGAQVAGRLNGFAQSVGGFRKAVDGDADLDSGFGERSVVDGRLLLNGFPTARSQLGHSTRGGRAHAVKHIAEVLEEYPSGELHLFDGSTFADWVSAALSAARGIRRWPWRVPAGWVVRSLGVPGLLSIRAA